MCSITGKSKFQKQFFAQKNLSQVGSQSLPHIFIAQIAFCANLLLVSSHWPLVFKEICLNYRKNEWVLCTVQCKTLCIEILVSKLHRLWKPEIHVRRMHNRSVKLPQSRFVWWTSMPAGVIIRPLMHETDTMLNWTAFTISICKAKQTCLLWKWPLGNGHLRCC